MADERNSVIARGQHLVEELCGITKEISDQDVGELFGTGAFDKLLLAILNPGDAKNYKNIGEFFLTNRTRASLLALIRHAIHHNYAIQGKNDSGQTGFVSPSHLQWYPGGVVLLESDKPFEGFMCLYRDGKFGYAVASRDKRPGEAVGPDHFEFIELAEFRDRVSKIPRLQSSRLDEPADKLSNLLQSHDNDESHYQELMMEFPWVLGAQHTALQRHTNLDDRNIPDFSGVRVHDSDRDIFELKPPFMKVFKKNKDFHSSFNDAWNQCERYLNFVREDRDYLTSRAIRFSWLRAWQAQLAADDSPC